MTILRSKLECSIFFSKLLLWIRNGGFNLLAFAVVLLLIWGTFAPVGTIVWWLDRGAEKMEKHQPIPTSTQQPIQLILMGTSGGAQIALGAAPGFINEISLKSKIG